MIIGLGQEKKKGKIRRHKYSTKFIQLFQITIKIKHVRLCCMMCVEKIICCWWCLKLTKTLVKKMLNGE